MERARASADSRPSYRRVIYSWAMYDWANSAFVTTVAAAMFPPFYHSMAVNAGASRNEATAYWAYTTSIGLLILAGAGPVLGAISDHTGRRKLYIGGLMAVGVAATSCFVLLGDDTWLLGSFLFIVASVCLACSAVFYESLLPHIAREGDIDRVSSLGYALGYVGGGILLVVNALWFSSPHLFLLPSRLWALRASFASVAAWWALFSIPLFLYVPEPPVVTDRSGRSALAAGLSRLRRTCGEFRRFRQLFTFLVAFWFYNTGINTIILMATAYGREIGIDTGPMIVALVMTQFVGVPASLAFGWLARRAGARPLIMCGLAVYTLISIGGYFMRTAAHFFALAFMVGLVQGGTQALSRSLYGVMVPKERSSEFFGFLSTTTRFAGIAGPLVFGVVGHALGTSRLSILSLVLFFAVGGGLLLLVDQPEGVRVAREGSHAG